MAYNSINLLKKIVDIQEIYLKYQADGVTGEYIYHHHIYPIYRISRKTFYNYLARNAKKELKDIQEAEKRRPKQVEIEF